MPIKTSKRRTYRKRRLSTLLNTYGVIGLLLTSIGFQVVTNLSQTGKVLPYATNISVSGLQSSQNNQRSANGLAPLSLNSQLASAAQAKANDMIARNYWSHNTPEGNTPWTFISAAGYSYTKAGENLAYGYLTSDGVVNGWMNSAGHRANVLDANYKDVGFGVANGASYQGGENTVVVAMYGQAATANTTNPAPTTPKTTPTPTPTPTPTAPSTTPTPAPTPTPVPQPELPTGSPEPNNEPDKTEQPQQAYTSQNSLSQPVTLNNSVLSRVARGGLKWTAYTSLLSTMVAMAWMAVKHTIAFKRAVVEGEEFVLTHPAVEISLLTVAMLLMFLGTTGFIR